MSAPNSLAQLPVRERIIRSLFSEKDEGGVTLESYITHVKIFEDVQYPSQPPPEPTAQSDLKERYILLSVKKNGRVRMHKSRGNDNGTFQIGKTWNLDDLQKIQDTDRRGMIVTLMKPYYWTMESAKDKYMFVSALTKVYKKYTGGRMFELLDFDPQHLPSTDKSKEVPVREVRAGSSQPMPRAVPQQTPPLRTQRSVSDFGNSRDSGSPRQESFPIANRPLVPPITIPGDQRSRATSSQYGGPDRELTKRPSQTFVPQAQQRPSRAVSESTDERARRVPPISNASSREDLATLGRAGGMRAASGGPGMMGPTASLRSPLSGESQPGRQAFQLGSPMTFREGQAVQSPVQERPSEKSLRRQAIESPITELAPPLRSNTFEPPRTAMSPPPPAKSPARRPSAIRTQSNGSSKISHDRLNELVSLNGSTQSSSIPEVPDVPHLPSKSGARVAGSPRASSQTFDRPELPWKSPPTGPQSGEYFPAPAISDSILPPVTTRTSTPSVKHASVADTPMSASEEKPRATPVRSIEEIELDDESAYVDEAIKNFRWNSKTGTSVFASRLNDELCALESANIHAIVENEDRVEDLMTKLDKGIAQCDDMANLLTIYEFELATVADHIKYIESQSQGLQVQTANQKALIDEIANVLTSITISEKDLDVLKGRDGNLESEDGVNNIERSLINLYNALKSMQDEQQEGGGMSAVRSKTKEYAIESNAFLSRLGKYLQIKFQAALLTVEPENIPREPSRVLPGHEEGFMSLVPYSSFMLYARQMGPENHAEYMKTYVGVAKASWRDVILNFAGQWRSQARKATGEESEMVFTAVRDHQQMGASRNATLKRSNTLAKQIRSVGSAKNERDPNDTKLPASDVFRIILDNLTLIISNEQNFITSFFHLSSFERAEFPDFVEKSGKASLTIEALDEHRPTESNRTLANERYVLMESIFGWLSTDFSNLVDHFAKLDPIQVIGMIKSVEVVTVEWADSDQEFMLKTFTRMKDRLMGLLSRFIDDQVKAIKDLKVTSKKRKGVIPVFEIFPEFVERIEVQLKSTDSGSVNSLQLEIRETVNEAFEQLSKAMFDSVRTLASSTSGGNSQGLVDVEDKEALNYHILMVQNMHQYLEALNSRNNPILIDFKNRAQKHYKEHLDSYTRQIVLRPLGRLVDFTDSVEKQIRANEDPTSKSAFSQTSLKRLLGDFEERDMRKGISAMWKRVDKHFSDDEGNNTGLLPVVWKATQAEYNAFVDRFLSIVHARYPEVKVDWTKQSIAAAFAKRDA